jgi:hypothetical protein
MEGPLLSRLVATGKRDDGDQNSNPLYHRSPEIKLRPKAGFVEFVPVKGVLIRITHLSPKCSNENCRAGLAQDSARGIFCWMPCESNSIVIYFFCAQANIVICLSSLQI